MTLWIFDSYLYRRLYRTPSHLSTFLCSGLSPVCQKRRNVQVITSDQIAGKMRALFVQLRTATPCGAVGCRLRLSTTPWLPRLRLARARARRVSNIVKTAPGRVENEVYSHQRNENLPLTSYMLIRVTDGYRTAEANSFAVLLHTSLLLQR